MGTGELERTGYRAPLVLRCVDQVGGGTVGDGLRALARRDGDTASPVAAARSPLSGLLGFGSLPGQRAAMWTRSTGGTPLRWPAPGAGTPFVVRIADRDRRFLPTTLRVEVPVAAPVEVPLFSAAARPAPSGWATVRGEVRVSGTGAPAAWSVLQVATDDTQYRTVADDAGRYLLYLPYPEALPPLSGGDGTGLAAVTWPLTVGVSYQPGELTAPGDAAPADPPFLASILGQAPAAIAADGGTQPTITAILAFGATLVLPIAVVPA